jgi:hypothetical protein
MIVIGNTEFKSKKSLVAATREKLQVLGVTTINSDHHDFQFFFDLLKRHPNADSKIGVGVSSFKIIRNPRNKKTFETHAIRKDGSKVDFAWTSCCSQKPKSNKKCLDDAMRNATKKTRPYFKNQCEICKTHDGPFDAHHLDPPFRVIADHFIKQHPEILEAKLTNGAGTFFHKDSGDIEQLWIDYHDTVVRYQYLCKPCHLKEDKKLKMRERNMNNITITIQAPELVEAMQALTVALQSGTVKPVEVEATIEKLEAEAKPKKAKADKPAEPVAEESKAQTNITLDDVRIALGNLSQAGKQAEVKTLIASFGATKLSEITSDKYADLMAQAEALNG